MKKRLLNTIMLALLCCCARQVGPGGGPDDIVPPQIHNTRPAVGSTGVGIHDKIVLTFSEWLDRKTAQEAVSIFPEPQQGIRVGASGRTITIAPVRAFTDSTTYHIEIGKALKDLHGNAVVIPYKYYFSTGTTLDSGAVSGCIVFPPGSSAVQVKAALFAVGHAGIADSAYSTVPDYVLQTDTLGGFTFNHIHKGRYALVGFVDNNNDNRIQPGMETVFAGLERTILVDSAVAPIPLYASTYDTVADKIITIKPGSSQYIAGYWLRGCVSLKSGEPGSWRIIRCDSSAAVLDISRYIAVAGGRRFMLFPADTLTIGTYRFVYPGRRHSSADSGAVRFEDTLQFSWSGGVDTVLPVVTSMLPQGQSDLAPDIKIIWSRPVISRMPSWLLTDSLGDTVLMSTAQTFSDTMIFKPQRKLKTSRRYRFTIAGAQIDDINGRHPADNQYKVTTMSSEDMCNSLSGSMPCLPADPSRIWLFIPMHSDVSYVSKVKGIAFMFDSLPAGKGSLACFSDYNGDGKPTPGSLVPWKKPEPFRVVADTIEARARWDIEGIVPTNCWECAGNTPESKQQPYVRPPADLSPVSDEPSKE